MQCNIDAKGKAIRLTIGTVVAITGLILVIICALRSSSTFPWCLSIATLLSGGFMIFEGAAGWCVVRAIGFRTRI